MIDVYKRQTVESVTAKQIEESANTVTTSGALQYLPSVHVRERYICLLYTSRCV